MLVALVGLAALGWTFRSTLGEDLTRVAPMPQSSTFFLDGSDTPIARAISLFDQRWVAWAVSRNARAWLNEPTRIFMAETCHPAENSLALGEPVLTLGLLGTPFWALGHDPVLTYNAVVMVLPAISMLAMFLLVRSWTGSSIAALGAGILYAFHRMKIANVVHPYYADTCWAVFAFYFFHRWLRDGRWRDVFGLVVACSLQLGGSVYPLVGIALVAPPYALWVISRFGLRRTTPAQWGALTLLVGAASYFILSPYVGLSEGSALIERPRQLHLPWRTLAFGQNGSPGVVLVALGLAGLLPAISTKSADPLSGLRWALLVGVIVGFAVATGGNAGDRLVAELLGEAPPAALPNPYAWMIPLLPVLGSVRIPMWVFSGGQMVLCALAGLGIVRLLERTPERRLATVSWAILIVIWLATLLPGLPGGLQLEMKRLRPDEEVLTFWQELAARGNDGPIIELPIATAEENRLSIATLLTAYHGRRTGYCLNSSLPPETQRVKQLGERVPDVEALDALRALGFTTLVVNREGPSERRVRRLERIEEAAKREGRLRSIYSDGKRSAYEIVSSTPE